MIDENIQDCNQKCREKYGRLKEGEIIQKILEHKTNTEPEYRLSDIPKEGLLVKLCTLECGIIEQGWRS